MKKNKIRIVCLSALCLFGLVSSLTSCNDTKSDTTVDPDDTTPNGHFEMWTDEQKQLLKTYCGEVIPYPVDLFEGEVVVELVEDSYNELSYVQIYDHAKSFTVQDYYLQLEEFGWEAITGYNKDVVQVDTNGAPFVEVTKANEDKTMGYEIQYFFSQSNSDDDGNEFSANVLKCYNDLSAKTTEETAWNDSQTAIMQDAITTTLPFINLGASNNVYKSNYNGLTIYDTYYKDLSNEYSKLLENDGYILDKSLSNQYNSYILTKKLKDGSAIQAIIYYLNGNNFYFYYLPNETSYTSWPTEVISEIKQETGLEIPQFDIATNGTYQVFKKNDSYFIYTVNLSNEFDYDNYLDDNLNWIGFNWDETAAIDSYYLKDSDSQNIGVQLVITPAIPTSSFSQNWPTSTISSALSTLKIDGVTIPELNDSLIPQTGKKLKSEMVGLDDYSTYYEYYLNECKNYPSYYDLPDNPTEDEIKAMADKLAKQNIYLQISIYDVNFKGRDAYENILYKAGWYMDYDMWGDTYYEDPTGSVSIKFSGYSNPSHDDEGPTYIQIGYGSGNIHEKQFEFESSEVEVYIGEETQLNLIKKMLPHDVMYSCSDTTGKITVDETGKVTVASDCEEGLTATITASIIVDGKAKTATCIVKTTKLLAYKTEDVSTSIDTTLVNKGYTQTSASYKEDELGNGKYVKTYDCGTSTTLGELKALIKTDVIPEGFKVYQTENENGDMVDCDWEDDIWHDSNDNEISCQSIGYSFTNPSELAYQEGYTYNISLTFYVYQTSDGHVHLVVTVY